MARLYGVSPGAAIASGALAPFSVVVTETPDGTLLMVTTTVLPGKRLELRAGDAASELEVRQVPDRQQPVGADTSCCPLWAMQHAVVG